MRRVCAIALSGAAVLAAIAGCTKKQAEEPAAGSPAARAEALAGPAIRTLRGRGNEPNWRVDLGEDAVVLTTMEATLRAGAPVLDATFADGAVLYVARGDEGEIAVKVTNRVCTDNMSGMPSPYRVQVWAEGRELQGCGGEPVELLLGQWTVDAIAGQPLLKDAPVTLDFGDDGSLSGSSGCNRLATSYELTGESLSIRQGAGTMMACDQPIMDQERAFLDLLSQVNLFGIADDGALLLKAPDGRAIRARR